MRRFPQIAAATLALSACALKGDVRRVELQVAQMRDEAARADSARAVQLAREIEGVRSLQRQILDSLGILQRQLVTSTAESRADHTEIQRQLIQIQELTGQSQQRLSELNAEMRRRQAAQVQSPDSAVANDAGGAQAEDLYNVSIQQLRRGSAVTARTGFQMLLDNFPTHPRAPDALYQLGEAWVGADADSATAAYERLVQRYPDSPRAPAALYRLGALAEQRSDTAAARQYYQRVVTGYPSSDEAELARTRLQAQP